MPFFRSMPDNAGPPNVFNKYPEIYKAWSVMSEALMNGPSPLSQGERELILAYAAGVTGCAFVCGAHSEVAYAWGIRRGLVEEMLNDPETASAEPKLKALLAYVAKLAADAERAHAGGCRCGVRGRLGRARAARRDLRHGARRLHAAPRPGPRVHAAAAGGVREAREEADRARVPEPLSAVSGQGMRARDGWKSAPSLVVAITVGIASLGTTGSALAQASKQEYPIPTDPAEDLTAIERLFTPPKPPPLTGFPELREQWKDTPAFLRDSRVSFEARSYFRDAVNQPAGTGIKQAWASGGSISAETGRLFDLVSLGAVLYTSFPVVAPPQYGNTGLLLPDQAGYAVFGQLYAQAHLWDTHKVTVGRHSYNTPFMGPHDNRMSPNTFSGYTLIGTVWRR